MSSAIMAPKIGTARGAGRTVGAFVLAHLALAMFLPFFMLDQIRGTEGIIANAAAHAGEFRAAILIFFLGTSMAIAAAIAAWPAVQRYSSAMALWLVVIAAAAFTLQAVDSGALMAMLSVSQEYAKADASKAQTLEAVSLVLNSLRRWTHFTYLGVAVGWMALLYVVLCRFALVPRLLAAIGFAACLLQMWAVTGRALFGLPLIMALAVPLGPIQLTLALWLMVKGFRDAPAPSGDQ